MTTLATDPVIRTTSDANTYLTKTQRLKIGQLGGGGFTSHGGQILQSWLKGYGNLRLSELLQKIGEDFNRRAANVANASGLIMSAGDFPDIFESRTLEDVNFSMAGELAADMPIDAVRASAIRLGANPAADETKLRTVFALYVAEWANAYGFVLDDWIEFHKLNPDADPRDFVGMGIDGATVTGSAGGLFGALEKIGEGARKFVRHPLKVLRRIFVTEIGKGLQRFAQNILNADKSAPWLSQFFLKPLGFHLQMTAVKQLGAAMVDGSISTFNEQAFTSSASDTFTAAGQALLVAAPFLPPPWNAAAAAVGALSVGVGRLINQVQVAAERQRQADAEAKRQSEMLSAAATQQARRQAEAAAKVEAGQYVTRWFDTPGGARYYGLFVLNTRGEPVPAWVWITDNGWMWLNTYE